MSGWCGRKNKQKEDGSIYPGGLPEEHKDRGQGITCCDGTRGGEKKSGYREITGIQRAVEKRSLSMMSGAKYGVLKSSKRECSLGIIVIRQVSYTIWNREGM